MKKNALYAQSGGVTSVINATASSLILESRKRNSPIKKMFAAKNGILGALKEELIDTSKLSRKDIESLEYRPGGIFGSCRYKLKDFKDDKTDYERLVKVFKAHDIGYFFYNGGNDSADTALKISKISNLYDHNINCIAIPKTVDNDLAITDTCPGFGSAAKYIASSTLEATLDVQSMCDTSTKVFILEVMGRHAGWMAASSSLAKLSSVDTPDLILLPEVLFDKKKFLKKVAETVQKKKYCVVVASEGIKDKKTKKFISESGIKDSFGHSQLGGVAPYLSEVINKELSLKNHWCVADYLQRSARHIASKVDLDQAKEVGKYAIRYARKGLNGIMPVIKRTSDNPLKWNIHPAKIEEIANIEKKLPSSYIRKDGFHVTNRAINYLKPLIAGEAKNKFVNGVPKINKIKLKLIKKKLRSKYLLLN